MTRHITLLTIVLIASMVGALHAQTTQTLVPTGSAWKYDDTGTDLGTAWQAPAYADSGWSLGPAPLGFGVLNTGEIGIQTEISYGSDASNKYTCTYFRHHFTLPSTPSYESLTVRVLRDDGCIIYLNGVEIGRSNMPSSGVTYSTFASGVTGSTSETTYYELLVSDPSMLVAGDNVLAVEVHQCNLTSSDLGFDLELIATLPEVGSPDQPVLVRPADNSPSASTSPTLEVTVSDPDSAQLTVDFWGRPLASTEEDFTIVVLPDTQKYVAYLYGGLPEMFTAQTQWIADNAATRNIVFVAHEGDITENGTVEEYDLARFSMSKIDPGLLQIPNPTTDPVVPYAVLRGNHDSSSENYNEYFPYSRYENLPWYGDNFPSSANDNSYALISAGGLDFIIVSLSMGPGGDDITWAKGELNAHSNRIGIIVTHSYLTTGGDRTAEGTNIWNGLISETSGVDNVYFVLCGHNHGEIVKTDVVNGRTVYQILADYQSYGNGGNGFLRTMEFRPAENRIYIETYSPYISDSYTDADSQFTLDFQMTSYEPIGTVTNVDSGTSASIVWLDLQAQAEHEWFVEVTDETSKTTVGPVWSFTTGLTFTASNPSPADGATQVDKDADLSWTPGNGAISRDVYFGTSDTPPLVANAIGQTTYDPGTMQDSTTYYWRVDEYDGTSKHTGTVWSFTTFNPPPVANDDAAATLEDNVLGEIIDVLGNDSDDGVLSVDSTTQPANGTVVINLDDKVTYTPDPDFFGTDTFTYTATDGISTDTAFVTVMVTNVNDDPVAVDDTATTQQGIAITIDVLANDTDVDGDALSVSSATQPANGTVEVNLDDTITYTPSGAFAGQDSFTYSAADGNGGSASATVDITVDPVNYNAYVSQEPTVTYGAVTGTSAGTGAADDGLTQTIDESPNGPAAYSLQVDYVLHTPAPIDSINAPVILNLVHIWTGADDPLEVSVWSVTASAWVEMESIITTGSYPADAAEIIDDVSGNIHIRFSDTVNEKRENKDTLTIDLLMADVSVGAVVPDTDPPAPPQNLAATAGDSQVMLDWDGNAESDLAGYRVYCDGAFLANVISSSYTDSSAINGVSYSYTVTAVDTSDNESDPSEAAEATPQDAPPSAPTGLAAVPGDSTITLDWDDNPETDVIGYNVYRDGNLIATVSQSTYPDTGLANGTQYTYYVTALDSASEGPAGSPVSATPSAVSLPGQAADPMPLDGATRVNSRAVILSWTAGNQATSHNVYLSTNLDPSDGFRASQAGTTFTPGVLERQTTYYWRIDEVNAAGTTSGVVWSFTTK